MDTGPPLHPAAGNGTAVPPNGNTGPMSEAHIVQALNVIFDTASSNEARAEATKFLDEAKQLDQAPLAGFQLALDAAHTAALRHYGLSMLEHAVKYRWEDYNPEQIGALRGYTVQLAHNLTEHDPAFLRNKVAQLWTEIAKRSWAKEWMDMDRQLVELWESSMHHREVVLYVLETLTEEVFNREDITADLRGGDLGRACVEIFAPSYSPDAQSETREGSTKGSESVTAKKDGSRGSLAVPVVSIQQAACDVLFELFRCGLFHNSVSYHDMVTPMFASQNIALLRDVYVWSSQETNFASLDDEKYKLSKKLAEFLALLGNFLCNDPSLCPQGELPAFLDLLFAVFANPSLTVSIPALHCFSRFLKTTNLKLRDTDAMIRLMAGLLETSCARLIRYEAFSEDSNDPTYRLLVEDIDTFPERHAFLGNYRRFCRDIIESVARWQPEQATEHILGQASTRLHNLYRDQPAFQPNTFSRHSPTVLVVDVQVSVVGSALGGYLLWTSESTTEHEQDPRQTALEDSFERWCNQLLQIKFEDPEIAKKVVGLLAHFASKVLDSRPQFALSFLDYLLSLRLPDEPAHVQYSATVKELEKECRGTMQKLASRFADQFIDYYDALERKAQEIMASSPYDERQRASFAAFLYTIVHRTTKLDPATQAARLKQIHDQLKDAWEDKQLTESLASPQAFFALLGLDTLLEFLVQHGFHQIQDWSTQPLSAEGQAMQANVLDRAKRLPLEQTKALLRASMDGTSSQTQNTSVALWSEVITPMLPRLLKILSHAHVFENTDVWPGLSQEMLDTVRKLQTDRFWQAGISTESREQFFARVHESRSTYDGFASSVRGTVRQIRETCYDILCGLSRMRDRFYAIPDFATPLSEALFDNTHALSPHHMSMLLNAASHILLACPCELQSQFLPPLITRLFGELDMKINNDWNAHNQQVAARAANEDLTEEMRRESVLRQLTSTATTLVSKLFGSRPAQPTSLAAFLLSTPQALEPVLLFCKTLMQVRDSRSVAGTVRLLSSLIPRLSNEPAVLHFFADQILQASIASLHQPSLVDCHRDLASLIATLIRLDASTARTILLRLPGMDDEARIHHRLTQIVGAKEHEQRHMRSLVLDLLAPVRGVSIHELGKVEKPKPYQSKTMEQYMAVDGPARLERGGSQELEGVAAMFGND